MAAGAVASLFISVLKALFSMISWFFGLFLKALKMLFCILPATAVVFVALLGVNLFILITGSVERLVNTSKSISNEEIRNEAKALLLFGNKNVLDTYNSVREWWTLAISDYKGSIAYIFLLFLTIIMLIPVVTVLLCITVFESYGIVLFAGIVVDVVIYVLRAILGKSFTEQFKGRYVKMFPEAGKKIYESDYKKWLKNKEYANDPELQKKRRADSFYDGDEDLYEDEDYYEEGDYYEDDEYYDDREYEDYDDSSYDVPKDKTSSGNEHSSSYGAQAAFSGTFDFFAGCNSRDSVDKKYKSLVKLYHPDNMDGDTAALQEINVQYGKAKLKFPV